MTTSSPSLNPIELLYTQILVQTAEQFSEHNPEAQKAQVAQELKRIGLTEAQIDSLQRNLHRQQVITQYGGIINPLFLQQRTGKRLYFFLIDARWGRFHVLQTMLGHVSGDLSYYGIYGPQDSLVGLYGTPEEMRSLRNSLEQSRFEPTFLEVDDIYHFYGYDVQSVKGIDFASIQVSRETLNRLAEDYWHEDVTNAERKQLQKQGVLLGPVIIEDLRLTGRIKAFVGINMVGRLPRDVTENFSAYLLNQGEPVHHCIRSIFRCKGTPYDYLLYLVCNSTHELDYVTNALNKDFPGASGLESSTFIVASARERLPRYIEGETLVLDISTQLRGEHTDYLRKLEQRYLAPQPDQLRQAYLRLGQRERLFLLQALDEFESYSIDDFSLEDMHDSTIRIDFINGFINGFLTSSVNQMSNAAMILGKFIEDIAKRALREALILVFPAQKLVLAQNDLKLPGSNIERFTLGQVWEAFGKLKGDSRYQRIGLQLDDMFLGEFQVFVHFRNRAAHNVLDELLHEDFSAGVQQIREAYRRSYWLLQQMRLHIFEPDYLPAALELALERRELDPEVHRLLSGLEAEISQASDRIQVRLEKLESRNRKRVLATLLAISRLDQSIQGQQKQQQQLINFLDTSRQEIMEHIQPGQESAAQQAFQMIVAQGKVLPGNVLASLLANILAGLSQPYLTEFLGQVMKLLR